MTISSFLDVFLQFLIKFAQSDFFLFMILGIALFSLYSIVTIIIQIIFIHRR